LRSAEDRVLQSAAIASLAAGSTAGSTAVNPAALQIPYAVDAWHSANGRAIYATSACPHNNGNRCQTNAASVSVVLLQTLTCSPTAMTCVSNYGYNRLRMLTRARYPLCHPQDYAHDCACPR
jgi:hypothetical protein